MKRIYQRGLWACSLAFSVLPLHAAYGADPAPATTGNASTEELYRDATSAYRDGKLVDAERLYKEAWSRQQTYDIATNLGAVELDLKKYRDAAEHLAFALRTFPARGKKEERETIATRLALAKTEVAALRIRVSPPKADVLVNGRRAGVAPLDEEVFAEAGSITVEANLDGHAPVRKTVDVKKGEAREVALALVPIEKPAGRSLLAPAIAFGVGGAGLVLGAVTAGVAAAGKDSLSAKCAPSGACDPSARGELESALALSRVSTVGFVIAGAGAAVGVTLLLLPGKDGTKQAAVQVGPGFVGVKGVF